MILSQFCPCHHYQVSTMWLMVKVPLPWVLSYCSTFVPTALAPAMSLSLVNIVSVSLRTPFSRSASWSHWCRFFETLALWLGRVLDFKCSCFGNTGNRRKGFWKNSFWGKYWWQNNFSSRCNVCTFCCCCSWLLKSFRAFFRRAGLIRSSNDTAKQSVIE